MRNNHKGLTLPQKLYDEIEKKIVSLYRSLNITTVPINPFEIVEQLNYVVMPYSKFNKENRMELRKRKISGYSVFDPSSGTYIIAYDNSQGKKRIGFTLMHEIGHIQMMHKESSELAETIANYFASYFLAPSPLIGHMACEDYVDVARTFKVSTTCADLSFHRYLNWYFYSGKIKDYEKDLIDLFENHAK